MSAGGPTDRYEALEEVPAGSPRRRVVRARDRATGAFVALKEVPAEEVRRELTALLAARLPGVVELVDHWVDGARATIVTRWIDGVPFPGPDPVPAATALLDVIDRVHRCGVVHRDLKPTNVLVDASGRVVVLDLGIAGGQGVERHTDDHDVAGTIRYVAPEQLLGDVDARSDLFAIGLMLYEALAGRLPHGGADLLASRLAEDPIPLSARAPTVPAAVAAAVDRLVARRPADRFPDARAAARALGAGGWRPTLRPCSTRRELRDQLKGPERIGSYRSRAAALAWRATRESGGTLDETLAGWERSGVIDRGLVIDPARLDAWEQAERGRLRTRAWVGAGGDPQAARARAEARRCLASGSHDRAVAVLSAALSGDPEGARIPELAGLLVQHAVALASPTARREAALVLRRWADPRLTPLVTLLDAADRVLRGDGARALAEVEGLEGLTAHVVRLQAARVLPVAVHEAVVEQLERWAEPAGEAAVAHNARGLLWYRQGRFRASAEAHEEAARAAALPSLALAARLNAAAAWMEVPDLARAHAGLVAARVSAVRLRHPGHQAFAEVSLASVRYRSGEDVADDGLVEDLEALGMLPLAAAAALVRAASAWRSGRDGGAAADRAERLAESAGRPVTARLAGALGAFCRRDRARIPALARFGPEVPAGVGAQVLALLGAVDGDPELLARARALAPWADARDVAREILTPDEVRRADIT